MMLEARWVPEEVSRCHGTGADDSHELGSKTQLGLLEAQLMN